MTDETANQAADARNTVPAEPAAPKRRRFRRALRLLPLSLPLVLIALGGAAVLRPNLVPSGLADFLPQISGTAVMTGLDSDSLPDPAAELMTRIAAVEARTVELAGSAANAPPAEDQLAPLEDRLTLLETTVRTLAGDLQSQTDALDGLNDTAAAALREARHARGFLNDAAADDRSRAEAAEADIRAVVGSLGSLRARMSSLSGRLDALAGDLHLMARFGYGQVTQNPNASRSTVIRQAPTAAAMTGSAGPRPAAEPPGELVQGRYRVGDWVGGWGVVTSIRKTPEGDHLTTPAGIVFAPAARGPAVESAGE